MVFGRVNERMNEDIPTITVDPFDCIDLVYSPDDGGFYFHEYHAIEHKSRTSKDIYSTKAEAMKAYREGCITWEEWW